MGKSLVDDRYRLTLSDAVRNAAGLALDGENPGAGGSESPLPSGDGRPGGPFAIEFTVDGSNDCNANGKADVCEIAGVGFAFPSFSSADELSLVGSSARSGNRIRITPALPYQAGAVWLRERQPVAFGFETEFTFNLNPSGSNGSDGFAFVIQDDNERALGFNGEYLGYAGIRKSVAVEFDTFQNATDPNDNHISVHTRGEQPNSADESFTIGSVATSVALSDGRSHRVKIAYASGRIRVFLDDFGQPVLQTPLNLKTAIAPNMNRAWVGFTAGTGRGFQSHDILEWSLTVQSRDCNGNNLPDECELTENDCDTDFVPDDCQVAELDCNHDGVYDRCQPDCDRNGIADDCDLEAGTHGDCNGNAVPDGCENGPLANHALAFDGANDLIRVLRSPVLEPVDALTVECWAKGFGAGEVDAILIRKAAPFTAGFLLRWQFNGSGRLHFQLTKPGLSQVIQLIDPAANTAYWNEWHHFAGVYSAPQNYARLYVDGSLVAAAQGFGPLQHSAADLWFGGTLHHDTESFWGEIEEVRIWNVARTEAEIQGTMNLSIVAPRRGLVGYWRLDEGQGQTTFDSSFFENHGQLGVNDVVTGDSADPVWVASEAPIFAGDCNENEVLDVCDIAQGTSFDCNGNSVLDECEFAGAVDCNSNKTVDLCEVGGSADCNENDVPDWCDVADMISQDCDDDLIPDECETDCNGNRRPDVCDLAEGTSGDCNRNAIPDECEFNEGIVEPPPGAVINPLNGNSYLLTSSITWPQAEAQAVSWGGHLATVRNATENQWLREVFSPMLAERRAFIGFNDIAEEGNWVWSSGEPVTYVNWYPGEPNNNGDEDWGEILFYANGVWNDVRGARRGIVELSFSNDCNENDVLDECDIADEVSRDCNGNGRPDECESGADCNGNAVQDICDLAEGLSPDCNRTGVPDECELENNDCNANAVPDECEDCNRNGRADECDVTSESSRDCSRNGIPDECEPDSDRDGIPDLCDGKGDIDHDADVDLFDYRLFQICHLFSGPFHVPPFSECVAIYDFDNDEDVDLFDYGAFSSSFVGD
jgi:hypothetical protein